MIRLICVPRSAGNERGVLKMPSETVSDGISMSAAALRNQPLKRLNTSVPLVPPKPKELEMATSISASRASLAQ